MARTLLDAIKSVEQPQLFGEPTRSRSRSAQPIGALVPAGMMLVYGLEELPGYEEYVSSNGDADGGWVLERPGVWRHTATDMRFVEPPRPEQVAASRCADCRVRKLA